MWCSKCQMHSNGCFPLTFYFSLAFIKTSGSLEPTTCTCAAITWSTNAHPEMVHSNSLKATVTGGARLFEDKDACIMSNWVLVFIMHMNSETRLLGVCLLCAVFQICEQPISISFLINVTSPLFNHTAYRHVLESQQKKKDYFSTQSCFEWKVINDIGNDAVTVRSSVANWYFCSCDFNNSMDLKLNTLPVVEPCSLFCQLTELYLSRYMDIHPDASH